MNRIRRRLHFENIFCVELWGMSGGLIFQKRRKLCQELTVSNMNKEEPQVYLGDFNDILSQEKKVGIHSQPMIYLETFRKFVDDNRLMDVDLKGSKFT
ncbi:hypothetical protein Ahy_B09g099889 [Arachis hypogaea]|uniref:Endonuclease/exonuclease/phosphatase domain-containing protein n=1 Tax=Arachis hypogaea TaxID=3818 RepID=A0A444XV73_ARAHY|nr:hypothetical protein Ahy_B09g099889 [Arachis hypogaea]